LNNRKISLHFPQDIELPTVTATKKRPTKDAKTITKKGGKKTPTPKKPRKRVEIEYEVETESTRQRLHN
jgi:hypothetical protein